MVTLRPAVHEFVRASETILSPASIGEPLNKNEREIIRFYTGSLNNHCTALDLDSKEC